MEENRYDDLNRLNWHRLPKEGPAASPSDYVITQLEYETGAAIPWHIIDGKNQKTTLKYDPAGVKYRMIYPDDPNPESPTPTDYQEWTYDANKNVIARRSASGATQLFNYDARNRPIAMAWSNGADWASFDYDAVGRMSAAQNPTSRITRAYDEANRMTLDRQRLQIIPISAVSRKIHGSAGTFEINLPLSGTPGVECRSGGAGDEHQIVVSFPRPITLGAPTLSGSGSIRDWNLSGDGKVVTLNLTGITNAQTLNLTLPGVNDGSVSNDVKLAMGVLLGDVNGEGEVNSGDISSVKAQSGIALTSANFRSDLNTDGAVDSGDVSVVKSKTGTATTLGSLAQSLPSSPDIDVQYGYDDDGKVQRLFATSANANYDESYQYETGIGRFQKILNGSTLQFEYHYDAASNEDWRHNYLNGVRQDYGKPDNLNHMVQRDVKRANNSVISHEGYGYDPKRPGLMTAITRQEEGQQTATQDVFTYNLLPELTDAKYGVGSNGAMQRECSYVFDKAGNRASTSDTVAGTMMYQTDTKNCYTTVGGLNVTNGNHHEMIAYENISYRYINDTRLASITGNGHSYSVNYDALGRAAVRVLDGSTTYFIYDGEKAILEYRNWSSPSAKNVYGKSIDEIMMRTDYTQTPTLTFYYQDDHEGSVTHLTNAAGAVIESYRYEAFGAPTIFDSSHVTRPSSLVGNRFMFTGREYVANFGIYEYRNRAYHPGLGRFMSEDPKGFVRQAKFGVAPADWNFANYPQEAEYNLFRYCGNDPVDFTDPLGLDTYTQQREIALLPRSDAQPLPRFGFGDDYRGHSFAFTTNPDGSIKHTYSWGNAANPRGWNRDQREDRKAAERGLKKGLALREGDSKLDPYVERAYQELKDKKYEHPNRWTHDNCHSERKKLLDKAREVQKHDETQKKDEHQSSANSSDSGRDAATVEPPQGGGAMWGRGLPGGIGPISVGPRAGP